MRSEQPDTGSQWLRQIFYGAANLFLFAAGLSALVVGSVAAWHEHTVVATSTLGAGLVLVFAATIDRFESIKGLGIEARVRILDRKINEADEALFRIRELAELSGATLIQFGSTIGRWDSYLTPRQGYELSERVRAVLAASGSSDATIRKLLRPWAQTACRDAGGVALRPLRRELLNRARVLHEKLEAFPQPIDPTDQEYLQTAKDNSEVAAITEGLNKLWQTSIDGYAEALLAIFDKLPGIADDQVVKLRQFPEKFIPAMRALRDHSVLPNSEAWFREIDEITEAYPA